MGSQHTQTSVRGKRFIERWQSDLFSKLAFEFRDRWATPEGGLVVIFDNVPTGWTCDFSRINSFRPGCFGVTQDGRVFETVGGNYWEGAKQWAGLTVR